MIDIKRSEKPIAKGLPCPWCGEKPHMTSFTTCKGCIKTEDDCYIVECVNEKCKVRPTAHAGSRTTAIKYWNNRV